MILTMNDTTLLSNKAVKKALLFQKQQCFFSLKFGVWSFGRAEKLYLKNRLFPTLFKLTMDNGQLTILVGKIESILKISLFPVVFIFI